MRQIFKIVQENMYKVLPGVILLTWLTLLQRLFIQPDGFFPTILNYGMFINKYSFINMLFNMFIMTGYQLVTVLVITLSLMSALQTDLSRDHLSILVGISGLIVWNFVSNPAYINWLILPIYVGTIILPLKKVTAKWRFPLGMTISLGYALFILIAQKIYHFNLAMFLKQSINSLIGDGTKNFVSTIIVQIISNIFNLIGLNNISMLDEHDLNLTTANDNLVATLQHHAIPYRFTIYPMSSFLVIGGAGMLLALFIALILQWRSESVPLKWYFVGIPLIFDLWWPLAFMLPIFWQFNILKRAIFVTLTNALIGSALLYVHLEPAVYWVPTGMPNLFFGGLASHHFVVYIMVTVFLLVIDVVIYWPVARQLMMER